MDKSLNKIAIKSGLWYTVSNFLVKSAVFITTPIFTRMLTQAEYGEYSNYNSWLQIVTIFITLNLGASFISAKHDYEEKFDQYVFSMLSLGSLVSIFSMVTFVIGQNFFSNAMAIDPIYLVCMVLYIMFMNAITIFKTKERVLYGYKLTVVTSMLTTFGTAAFSIAMVYLMENRLSGLIYGGVIPTMVIGSVLGALIVYKGKHIDLSMWKYALPICLPFVPHLLSMTVLGSMDRIMINKMCGSVDAALYSVAYTCGLVIMILVNSLNQAYAPWLGDQLYEGESKYNAIRNTSKYYISIFVVFAFGLMLFTPEILLILGGESYIEAKYVLAPVSMGCVCQYIYTLFVNVEQIKKKTLGMAVGSMSAAALNYVLNLIFIPRYGYIAAAYTTLFGYLWLMMVHMFLVYRLKISQIYDYKFITISVSASFIYMGLVLWLFNHNVIRYIIAIAYIVTLMVIMVLKRNEVKKLIKLIVK